MLVVSNTSPISNLAIIGRLELLKIQCGEIWIPPAVEQELANHPIPPALAAIQASLARGWVRPAVLAPTPWLNVLLGKVHRGEAEAIALAVERNADLVVMDEQEGRQLAIQAGLSVTGVLGILLRAKSAGDITAVRPEIQRLRSLAHFFIAPELEAQVLSAAGE